MALYPTRMKTSRQILFLEGKKKKKTAGAVLYSAIRNI
jgi:hypothetical protein